MPRLSVNLDDPADCRLGIQLIRQHLRAGRTATPRGRKLDATAEAGVGAGTAEMPLRKKLTVIKQRGVWRHLVSIAQAGDTPKSLNEWDAQLELPRNKMRSLKAIFAKLENRWDVRFMRVAEDAGCDESGNPRYVMPPRIRNQILSLVD